VAIYNGLSRLVTAREHSHKSQPTCLARWPVALFMPLIDFGQPLGARASAYHISVSICTLNFSKSIVLAEIQMESGPEPSKSTVSSIPLPNHVVSGQFLHEHLRLVE